METENTEFLLTIAIPTYNRRNLLKRALDSIVPQLNPKVEILVSDNASDDGTDGMIAESYPMVRYIKNAENMGWDYNFLQCYREAKGKYVILLGSDDRMSEGAVDYLIGFLQNNDCDLVFMNYRFYDVTREEVYLKDSEHIKNFQNKQDIVTTDRNLFMKYANHGITFISASAVRNSMVLEVKNPEKFFGTNFIHTYVMLEALKNRQALFGVIMKPLIEDNATKGDSEISKTPNEFYTVFGKCIYDALCVHAVNCGFDKSRMRKVFLQFLSFSPYWKPLLNAKRNNNTVMIEKFWQDGYPVAKHFPSEWIMVMLVVITPRWAINVIRKIYKTFKKDK